MSFEKIKPNIIEKIKTSMWVELERFTAVNEILTWIAMDSKNRSCYYLLLFLFIFLA